MTNEKRLEAICAMLFDYDRQTGYNAAKDVISNPYEWVKSTYFPFYANAASLILETKEAISKANHGTGTTAAVKRVLKACKDTNPRFNGYMPYKGKSALCAGCYMVILNSVFDFIPKLDERATLTEKAIAGVMEPANNNSVNPVTLPSIAEIKAAIAEHKATKGRISKYNPCKIGVADCYLNADHLLNIMQVLPGCTARKEAGSKKGIFFESDTGEAFLLPVNPNY